VIVVLSTSHYMVCTLSVMWSLLLPVLGTSSRHCDSNGWRYCALVVIFCIRWACVDCVFCCTTWCHGIYYLVI